MTNRSIFQLIDLDRTLFDTATFAKALTDEIERHEPGVGARLNEQYEIACRKEETFFLLRYLRHDRGNEWFEALVDRVVERIGASSLRLSGIEARLAYADTITDVRPSWGILTYGDAVDQRMKARLIGLEDAPMYIADTPDKGELLRMWQADDGTFQLPAELGGQVVNQLTFEDDKLRAFRHLPDNVEGFWVTTDPAALARLGLAQEGDTPQSVTIVKNLNDVVAELKRRYK